MMKLATFLIAVQALLSVQSDSRHVDEIASARLIDGIDNRTISYFRTWLGLNHKVGRIYVSSRDCSHIGRSPSNTAPFDHDRVLAMSELPDRVFSGYQDATVREGPSNVIEVEIGHVDKTILQSRIESVDFDELAQYNSLFAVMAVENSAEFRRTLSGANAQIENLIIISLVQSPHPGAPHLPDRLANVTADEALNTIAKTFGSIVIYYDCPDERKIRIDIG